VSAEATHLALSFGLSAQIMTLQEELDAYDNHQRMLEDALDQKSSLSGWAACRTHGPSL